MMIIISKKIIAEKIIAEVAAYPEVKDAEKILNTLLEIIFEGNPELFDKAENAIYNYTEQVTKHTCPLAFVYGMRAMSEINQITGQPNIPV